MDERSFVYVTYIATTAERLWEALTSAAFSERYWFGSRVESEWTVGAPVRHTSAEGVLMDTGIVLECDPPRRLSYSWIVEWDEALRREGASRVTFTLEPADELVKLTLVHDEFTPDSEVRAKVSNGWPMVLSGLKSLLETGAVLSVATAAPAARARQASAAPA